MDLDGSILWKAIYFSDLADIVAYFMRAVLREGVGVVDRTRGKARCACFAPESHMNMDMSGAQSNWERVRPIRRYSTFVTTFMRS